MVSMASIYCVQVIFHPAVSSHKQPGMHILKSIGDGVMTSFSYSTSIHPKTSIRKNIPVHVQCTVFADISTLASK